MKKLASTIAFLAIAFTVSTSVFASDPIQHPKKTRHITYHEGDPLGRNHWTYGRRARMQKQILQAQYHEQQVERAEAAQQKVEKERARKHIN